MDIVAQDTTDKIHQYMQAFPKLLGASAGEKKAVSVL